MKVRQWLPKLAPILALLPEQTANREPRLDRNISLIIGLCIACPLGSAQSSSSLNMVPQRSLSMRNATQPIEELIKAIGKEAGTELRVSPELAGRYVIVSLRSASLRETMEQVADALSAEWMADGSAFVLRSKKHENERQKARFVFARAKLIEEWQRKERRKEEARQEFDRISAKSFVTSIEQWLSNARESPGNPQNVSRLLGISSTSPITRLVALAACALPARIIGERWSEQVITFAERPVGIEVGLGQFDQSVKERAVRELSLVHSSLGEHSLLSNMPTIPALLFPEPEAMRADGGFRVVVQCESERQWPPRLQIRVFLANGTGQVICVGERKVDPTNEAPLLEEMRSLPNEDCQLSAKSQELVEFYERGERGEQRKPLSDEVRDVFLSAERRDPSELVLADIVKSLSQSANRSVICMPGELTWQNAIAVVAGGKLKLSDFFQALAEMGEEVVTPASGWVVIRPKFPFRDTVTHVKRSSLGNYCRTGIAAGGFSVDGTGVLTENLLVSFEETRAYWYLYYAAPTVPCPIKGQDTHWFQLHRQMARAGLMGDAKSVELTLAELPGPVVGMIEEIVFRKCSKPFWWYLRASREKRESRSMRLEDFVLSERFPAGLPKQTVLRCRFGRTEQTQSTGQTTIERSYEYSVLVNEEVLAEVVLKERFSKAGEE